MLPATADTIQPRLFACTAPGVLLTGADRGGGSGAAGDVRLCEGSGWGIIGTGTFHSTGTLEEKPKVAYGFGVEQAKSRIKSRW